MTTDVHLQTLETAAGAVEPSLVWACDGGVHPPDPDGPGGDVVRDEWHWSIYASTEPVDVVRAFYAKLLDDGDGDGVGGSHWQRPADVVFTDPWSYHRRAWIDVVPVDDVAHLRCTDGRAIPAGTVTLVAVTGQARDVVHAIHRGADGRPLDAPDGDVACADAKALVTVPDVLPFTLIPVDDADLLLSTGSDSAFVHLPDGLASTPPQLLHTWEAWDGWSPRGLWSPVRSDGGREDAAYVGGGLLVDPTYDDPVWWQGDVPTTVPGLPPRWSTRLALDRDAVVATVQDDPAGGTSTWTWRPGWKTWKRGGHDALATLPREVCGGGDVLHGAVLPDGHVVVATWDGSDTTLWALSR